MKDYLENAGIAQLVEHDLAKVGVAGPSPVSRSNPEAVPITIGIRVRDFFEMSARVVELVDTLDLKSNEHRARAGSSPASSTFKVRNHFVYRVLRTFLVVFAQPLQIFTFNFHSY